MRRVVVHIDRLLLHGLPVTDPRGVAEGLRSELGRQLAVAGTLDGTAAGANAAPLRPAAIKVGRTGSAAGLGHQVARAIAGAIHGTRSQGGRR